MQNKQSSKIVHARMITAKLRKAIAIDANSIVASLYVILLYANKPTAMHRNALTNFQIIFMKRVLSDLMMFSLFFLFFILIRN